jgi:ubiquinone/menaquinone biosynthesis C-methylase UbiE
MTEEMLDLARANAARAGADNVEFLRGDIEAVPLPDGAVDVVISNCVINLSTDKPAVLAEMCRVLVPGGRIGISDVVAEDTLTPGSGSDGVPS